MINIKIKARYIRTKDGIIYDLESKEISSIEYIDKNTAINEYKVECAFYTIYYYSGLKGHYLECDNKGGYSCDFIEEKDILKQSDTIEELCDEFRELLPKYKGNDIVGYEPEKWEYSVSDGKFYNDIGEWCYREDFIIRGYVVYGAIWCDEGLIYVAKMNDKSELELL